jgi:hypothetical protein
MVDQSCTKKRHKTLCNQGAIGLGQSKREKYNNLMLTKSYVRAVVDGLLSIVMYY